MNQQFYVHALIYAKAFISYKSEHLRHVSIVWVSLTFSDPTVHFCSHAVWSDSDEKYKCDKIILSGMAP